MENRNRRPSSGKSKYKSSAKKNWLIVSALGLALSLFLSFSSALSRFGKKPRAPAESQTLTPSIRILRMARK